MASTLKNSTSDGEWTVVVSRKAKGVSKTSKDLVREKGKVQPQKQKALEADPKSLKPRPNPRPNPRRGQEERRTPNPRRVQEGTKAPNPRQGPQQGGKEQQLKPKYVELDPERQGRLLQKMESAIWKTRRSNFYTTFLNQLKSPAVSEQIRLLLGNETHLQMVIYGLGRIEQNRDGDSRIQLSIALSMKREFDWIGDIQIYDPNLSATECSVLEILGCTVLSMNEAFACRAAKKPTLYFMQQCSPALYGNIMQENLRTDGLSKIALLGESLKSFKEDDVIIDARRRITREFPIEQASGDFGAFNDLSWHFFGPGVDNNNSDLPITDYGLFPPLMK